MNTTTHGRNAEEQVSNFLKQQGHTILALNWRNRWCEIDIVSEKKSTVFFTEVKYRSSAEWGDGFAYITPKKVAQMQFAAEFWLSENNWNGDCSLQAASVDNEQQIEIVEIV